MCFIYLYLFSNCKPFCTIIIFLRVFNHTYPLLTHNGKIYIIYDCILLTTGHVSTNLSWRVKHCVSIYLKWEKESSKASFQIRKKDILERPHSLASVNHTIWQTNSKLELGIFWKISCIWYHWHHFFNQFMYLPNVKSPSHDYLLKIQ